MAAENVVDDLLPLSRGCVIILSTLFDLFIFPLDELFGTADIWILLIFIN
jgi:hypothetical protein